MATQGMISVLQDGKVVMKIVSGCDGYNAPELAKAIRELDRLPKIDEAYGIARRILPACESCLVVITEDAARYDGDDEVHALYRETFNDPYFNPRFDDGRVEYLEIVELRDEDLGDQEAVRRLLAGLNDETRALVEDATPEQILGAIEALSIWYSHVLMFATNNPRTLFVNDDGTPFDCGVSFPPERLVREVAELCGLWAEPADENSEPEPAELCMRLVRWSLLVAPRQSRLFPGLIASADGPEGRLSLFPIEPDDNEELSWPPAKRWKFDRV